MARIFDGFTDYARYSGAVVTAYPFTMACWFNANNTSAYMTLMSLTTTASDTQYFALDAMGNETGDPIGAVARNTSYTSAATSTGYSASVWNHAAAVFASSTSKSAYLNGGSKGTDTTSVSYPTMERTSLGATDRPSRANYFRDSIAHAAIWDVALSDAEISSLGKGVIPLSIRPQSIVAYWPLWGNGSPEPDEVGGNNLTLTGTSKISSNPRLIYLPRKRLIYIPSAGGGSFQPAWARNSNVVLQPGVLT